MENKKLLKMQDLQDRLQVSRSAVYREMGRGQFPKPIKIGKSARWKAEDIDAWLDRKAA